MAQPKAKDAIRLERGEGSSRMFWEVNRSRLTLTTRFGHHLSAGRVLVKRHESIADAAKAFDKAVAEKRREGYTEPAVRAKAGAMSRKGVSARHEDLESAIEAAPDDADRYLVYADWLQQQGDPRGELIAIQHRLAETDDSREITALERDEATLFKEYEEELLGPLAPLVTLRNSIRSYRTFSWRHGFIRTARMRKWTRQTLTDLFTHPSGRFLEQLVTPPSLDLPDDPEDTYDVLRSLAPRTLSRVFVDDVYGEYPISVAPLWMMLPAVRCVTLNGPVANLGEPRGSSVETLRLRWARTATLEKVAANPWPALKRLHATLLDAEYEPALAKLLDKRQTPSLAHASVRMWFVSANQVPKPIAQDALARFLVRLGAARGLARLDLEMPISTEGARVLLSAKTELRAIRALSMVPDLIDRDVRAALVLVHPAITWMEPPEEEGLELAAIDAGPLRSS